MRIGLVIGEALLGLRRNLSMVISVVLVTFVSLTFVGAAVLMQTQIQTMRGYWGEKAEVTVYMCSPLSTTDTCIGGEATEDQIEKVKQTLEGDALSPLITSGSSPVSALTRAQNSSASAASRTAQVAIVRTSRA